MRFYKSKLQIKNAITKQTEMTTQNEGKKYLEEINNQIEKQIGGLLINNNK